jgi:hypothetical protein
MAIPVIDDIELRAVQYIRQETDQGFARHRIAGLDGTLHQKLGRRSHRVSISGMVLSETAEDDLGTLQEKATSGEEVTFVADITTALEVEKMVIESLTVEQRVGRKDQYSYMVVLAESPPLPPPAEVSPFGGLGEFGLGDLGFDADALGGLVDGVLDQAGSVMDTLDSALDAVEQLSALASLADLADIASPLKPVSEQVEGLGSITGKMTELGEALGNLTPGGD